MRITHVITRLIVGGAQENTVATVLGLQNKPNIKADLISGPTHGPEGSLESRLTTTPGVLTIVPTLVRPVHPVKDWLAFRQLTTLFRSTRPFIVHTHSGKAGILGRRAAYAAGVPVIVHTIHGPSFGPFQGRFSNWAFRAAERYAAKATTHFVTVADAMTRQYLDAGVGTPEQYTRVFSGFPLEPFLGARNDPEMRARLGIGSTDLVVGKIARLFELKGHDDLLTIAPDLVKRCPRIKFLFVGDGLWRERLQLRARSLGLERHFVFTGLVPPEDIPLYVGVMDVVAHLSRREGLPRALSQALAAARPVVAYDCDGAREVCIENQTGFLVRPGDLASLSERLLQLANNPELRRKFGEHGRRFARDNFSVETMVEDLYRLYLDLEKTHTVEQSRRSVRLSQ